MLKFDIDTVKRYQELQKSRTDSLMRHTIMGTDLKEPYMKLVASYMCMDTNSEEYHEIVRSATKLVDQYKEDKKSIPVPKDFQQEEFDDIMIVNALIKHYTSTINKYITPESFLISPYVDNLLESVGLYADSSLDELFEYPVGIFAISNSYVTDNRQRNIRIVYLLSINGMSELVEDLTEILVEHTYQGILSSIIRFKEVYANTHKLFLDTTRLMAKERDHIMKMYESPSNEVSIDTLTWLSRFEGFLISKNKVRLMHSEIGAEINDALNSDKPRENFKLILDEYLFKNYIIEYRNHKPLEVSLILTKMIVGRIIEEQEVVWDDMIVWKNMEKNMFNGIDMVIDPELLKQTVDNFIGIRQPLKNIEVI